MIRHKFLIGDVLKKVTTKKLLLKAKTLPKTTNGDKSLVPLMAAGIENQGCVGYVKPNEPTVLHSLITVSANGANSGVTFYQQRKFSILQDSYALELVDKYADYAGDNVYLYLTAVVDHRLKDNGYNNKATWNRIKNYYIELPVTPTGDPDFKYMTMRIRELEAERIRELEAYLRVTGLDDTTLSASEAQALTRKIQWKKFRIGNMFEKPGKGDVDLQNDDVDGIGEYFINSGETNLGIKGRTSRKAKVFPKNTITIDFFGNVYYRDFSYKLATHNHVFSFQSDLIKSREIGLYLVGALGYLKKKFSYHNMLTWNKLKKLDIQLPVTSTGDIDFDYMQNYIRAMEKQTIKGVVEYKDRVIEETKKVVNG